MPRITESTHTELVYSSLDPSGGIATDMVDDHRIVDSWGRCLQEYDLDPTKKKTDHHVIEQTELKQRRERQEHLIQAAEPELENLYNQILSSGSCVLLAESDGTILQGLFDPSIAEKAIKSGLRQGAIWSEENEGTNGIGTAISTSEPMTVHLHDHFRSQNIALTCSGAPIFDPNGEVAGVVDVSSASCSDSRRVQQHTLALVSMTAKSISNRMFLNNYRDSFLLRFHSRRELVGLLCEGILALDSTGKVKACNESALLMMGCTNRNEICDKRIDEVFDGETQRLLNKAINDPFSPVQIRDRSGGRSFYAVFQIPKKMSNLKVRPKRACVDRLARPANLSGYLNLEELAGNDTKMHFATECARRVMDKDIPIVVLGETGTGKEAIAHAIHNASERRGANFVAINCAAIPENLIESELFGYKGGAFTGARKDGAKGKILQADGGTLFLDEIGDMPLDLQTRLLRVLEEREILPIGAEEAIPVTFDVIVATHRDILSMVSAGEFRQDLYYRLNGITLNLPSLKERQDISQIIQNMLKHETQSEPRPKFSAEAMSILENYPWPGNIRQLKNAIRVALALRNGDVIGVEALPTDITNASAPNMQPSSIPSNNLPHSIERPVVERNSKSCIAEAERKALLEELNSCRWNVTLAAKRLDMSRATLYRKMKKHQILENDTD